MSTFSYLKTGLNILHMKHQKLLFDYIVFSASLMIKFSVH